jgi:hypothetical protein
VHDVAARFDDDVSTLLGPLGPAERQTLSQLIGRMLAAEARARGIDLFPAGDDG